MNYRQSIDWLYGAQITGIKLGLESTKRLLELFDANPPSTTKIVHVAGTNGKGSTCAMIDALARACGKRCGLFTSPHLIDFRERIKVNGEEIPEDACASLLTQLKEICAGLDPHPTFFELTTALALRWFALRECEVIVLETGLGGRLDSTSAVVADVCVITPIGMDHMEWLGDTPAKIAAEKAAIMLSCKPTISAPQIKDAEQVLRQVAAQRQVRLSFVNEPLIGYYINLAGEHQKMNAALAVEAAHALGLDLRAESVKYALENVVWQGRFERIGNVVLDGAHNPHAAAVLANTWREVFPHASPTLIFGAAKLKDIGGVLALIAPLASRIFLCPINSARSAGQEELFAALPPGAKAEYFDSALAALEAARAAESDLVLVAGSLFLVGEIRAHLLGKQYHSSLQ